jgi:hypothetical protein
VLPCVKYIISDILAIAIILPIFAAAWLPFYDNWRWAYTGDSFGIFCAGYWLAKNRMKENILSVDIAVPDLATGPRWSEPLSMRT